jgi:hypothetical protein
LFGTNSVCIRPSFGFRRSISATQSRSTIPRGSPVDAGHEQNADFVDEVRSQERPIDVAAAFEQQAANSEMLAKQVYCFGKINRRVAFLPFRNRLGPSRPVGLRHRSFHPPN